MIYKNFITILFLICGQEALAYKTVINESWGKMEMLEQIDQYLKNTVSKDLSELKAKVKKLESKNNKRANYSKPQRASRRENYSTEDFQQSIRQVNQQISRNKTSIGALESTIRKLSDSIIELRKEISILEKNR